MIEEQIAKEITNLIADINYHNDLYHNKAAPEISDYEFDQIMARLIQLEAEYPNLVNSNSPTRRVGSSISKNFRQVNHIYPMLSLANTYSNDDIQSFYSRVCKLLNMESIEMLCELKFDGVAISLVYENGSLLRAVTRGNGVTGDEITQNALRIKSIPKTIPYLSANLVEVRGEVFMTRKQLNKLNRERIKNEEQPWANPRNITAGTLKLLDSNEVAKRQLEFLPYTLLSDNKNIQFQEESLDFLKKWGFSISDTYKKCKTKDEVVEYINYWEKQREFLAMDIDGLVIKVNNLNQQRLLGSTSHSPRWAVAYKYKPKSASTKLISVYYQVGRTGAITPVAELVPIELAGTVVKRASLYNANFIEAMQLHNLDTVYIEKGGDIIPKLTAIDFSKRDQNSIPVKFPTHCPECNSLLHREDYEAIYYCLNHMNCLPQAKARLVHFVSKNAMDIDSVGPKTVEALFTSKLVANPSDLYGLTYDEVISLDGFKHQSAERLISGIAASKTTSFGRIIYALGIRHVGVVVAQVLAQHFVDIDSLMKASIEELYQIDDLGIKTAVSIRDFFSDADNINQIGKLKYHGLNLRSNLERVTNNADYLLNKSFVITGTFKNYERDELKHKIKNLGGTIITNISKQTSHLIVGDNPGPSKLQKAKELNIEIIFEDQLGTILVP
jgi:DNA ligase (NAD+)